MPRRQPVSEVFGVTRTAHATSLGVLLLSVALTACASSSPSGASSTVPPTGTAASASTASPAKAAEPASAVAARDDSPPRWLTSERPDLRRLTVVIEALPPTELAKAYRAYAKRYGVLSDLFLAHAGESFGSGFVMVRSARAGADSEAQRHVFVVTNRHVVGMADDVLVRFQDAPGPYTGRVIYVDDRYDLAIVSLEEAPVEEGFRIEGAPPHDQDLVVASGYPPLLKAPSYQVTRGYVSNERFLIKELSYVQHTAPIDRGSSGGPLTNQAGAVLGMNTYKVSGRENVGIAVPASVVAKALEHVAALLPNEQPLATKEKARAACEELVTLLETKAEQRHEATGRLGARLVAEQGVSSLSALGDPDEELRQRFVEDPTEIFLEALAARLSKALERRSQGTAGDSRKTCTPIEGGSTATEVTFEMQLDGSARKWTFVVEQNRWKLSDASLGPAREPALFAEQRTSGPKGKWKPSLKRR